MTKKAAARLLAVIMIFGGLNIFLFTQPEAIALENTSDKEFRVVGYYSGDLFNEPVEKLQTDKLTHIMYAFLIPTEDGSLVPMEKPEQLSAVVEKAHADDCQVFIALGGWSYKGKALVSTFEKIGASDQLRGNLVKNIVEFVLENDLDGVELDWEHPNEGSIKNYEKLAVELAAALKVEGKVLTAALNGAWSTTAGPEVSKLMTNTCLDSFDFICVMAYDMNNEEHSPLWFAGTSISYWLNRGVAADKIVVGLPLYARPSWIQYRHLVDLDEENAYLDYIETKPLESYYNGLNTLREKTLIALRKAGGVMLFDVNEDTSNETSVVSMIDETIKNAGTNPGILIVINNKPLFFSETDGLGQPFLDANNRTLVPMRKPLEAIGAELTYDKKTQIVTAVKDGTTVTVIIGQSYISVDGEIVPMDTSAIIKDDRTYIPLRAVFEGFGYTVTWSGAGKVAYAAQQ